LDVRVMVPVIFCASFTFIFLFLFYFLIVASLRPAGELEAWRLLLGALNPVRLQSFNHVKNSSQLVKYDAGRCSCGVIK
jgi:hypothetical protein